MPDDPSLTHTFTTREAGEGVERCQCDELRAENERLRRLEASHQVTFKVALSHQNRADAAENEVQRLKAEVELKAKVNSDLDGENTRLAESLANFTARNADLRAKGDALHRDALQIADWIRRERDNIWRPDLTAINTSLAAWLADAARQPTEAR